MIYIYNDALLEHFHKNKTVFENVRYFSFWRQKRMRERRKTKHCDLVIKKKFTTLAKAEFLLKQKLNVMQFTVSHSSASACSKHTCTNVKGKDNLVHIAIIQYGIFPN